MDERISRALADLRRAGISLPVLVAEAARKGEVFSDDEIIDVVWAVAEQRGIQKGIEELGAQGKAGRKPTKTRLGVLKWLALQGFLVEALGKKGWEKYKPKGLATLVAWIEGFRTRFSIRGTPRQEPLYDTQPFRPDMPPPTTYNTFNFSPHSRPG